jgi:hypothetical protein
MPSLELARPGGTLQYFTPREFMDGRFSTHTTTVVSTVVSHPLWAKVQRHHANMVRGNFFQSLCQLQGGPWCLAIPKV